MAGQLIVNQVISTVETQVYSPQDYHQTEVKVQALAAEHQLSRFQLARLFKKHSGKDLTGFIQRMKLEAAANIVSYTHTPLLELALNLGYTSQQAFTRAFSQYWGISPGKMRSQRQDYVRYLHDAQGQLRVNCQIRRNRTGLKLWAFATKATRTMYCCIGNVLPRAWRSCCPTIKALVMACFMMTQPPLRLAKYVMAALLQCLLTLACRRKAGTTRTFHQAALWCSNSTKIAISTIIICYVRP